MSVERAREFLSRFGMEDKIITFKESSATVELAAKAAGTEPARIAKTLSFTGKEHPVLITEPLLNLKENRQKITKILRILQKVIRM